MECKTKTVIIAKIRCKTIIIAKKLQENNIAWIIVRSKTEHIRKPGLIAILCFTQSHQRFS